MIWLAISSLFISRMFFYFRVETKPILSDFYNFFLEKSAMGAPENEMEEFQESRKLLNLDEKLIKRMFAYKMMGPFFDKN